MTTWTKRKVSTQLSIIDVLLSDLNKNIAPCANKKNEKKEEENQDAMPDSTTNTEKNNANPFHCGDDVLVPKKDGRYYLGTIVELSTSNDNDSCEVGTGVARCLVKFGDGTDSWAPVSTLKLLSAPPVDDGRIMCVVCKRREGPASSPQANAVIACDMCGRGYHAKCHNPPVEAWINGASWHCKRCVDQRYKVAAAENRASKRSDFFRFKGTQRRQQQEMTPPCDTASTTSSTASENGKEQSNSYESHCYCGDTSDWLAQMLLCCRCSRWFHQRCVPSLQYPLYAGDKLYIFSCADCNGGSEYLRRLELSWLDLAHLALYNLTAYNAPNYFDLDRVIMPYIRDNWHVLQLPESMWRTAEAERREQVLTALTSSRKRFKCGREMKKRATIWGLRLRRPPDPPELLASLRQIKKREPLTDELVREYAPRLRFLPRATPESNPSSDDGFQPSSSNKSSYKTQSQQMIVPVDGHWIHLMMGKRFHENFNSNSNSENDSTSSYETKINENHEPDPVITTTPRKSNAKDDNNKTPVKKSSSEIKEAKSDRREIVPSLNTSLVPCSMNIDSNLSKDNVADVSASKDSSLNLSTHSSKLAMINMEVSKLSTKNIIEHSKIMSLQHMDSSILPFCSSFNGDLESSGDETSSRGTLDAIIPPLKDFQGKNNPFLMKNSYSSSTNIFKPNGRLNYNSRFPGPHLGPLVRPLKRKLSEKDIVIGPNGEVKRRKYRRPRKYLQLQNKSAQEESKNGATQIENGVTPPPQPTDHAANNKAHGRRLRQRQEKNYYENARRNSGNSSLNSSVKSLQLSPHKVNPNGTQVEAEALSALKSSIQTYFRAGQTFQVLGKRITPGNPPAFLIQWDTASST